MSDDKDPIRRPVERVEVGDEHFKRTGGTGGEVRVRPGEPLKRPWERGSERGAGDGAKSW